MKKILSSLVALITSLLLFAQPGTLDDSFADNGILITSLDYHESYSCIAMAIAHQPDGKIVFAGNAGGDIMVARLYGNGSLDDTFGTDGKTSLDFYFDFDVLYDMAMQPDGKIVVVGASVFYDGTEPTMWMVRFHSDGSVDEEFNSIWLDFRKIGEMFGTHDPEQIVVQPDGKILVAGSGHDGAWKGFVARFFESGEPDPSFGQNGYQIVKFNNAEGHARISDMVLLPSGKLVVGGTRVARLDPNGSYDTSFGDGGVMDAGYFSHSVAVQADGKVLVIGNSGGETKVKRFLTNGQLDNSYGNGGQVVVSAGGESTFIVASALQPDGKLVAVGGLSSGSQPIYLPEQTTVLRFTTEGFLDDEFHWDGIIIQDLNPEEQDGAMDVLVQHDGKILVAGYHAINPFWGEDFAFLRYLSGLDVGTVDFSVSNNQVFTYPNPIKETATLKYTLTHPENISVQLYGIDGRLLHSYLTNEKRNAGEQAEVLAWPSGIPAGNYVLSIATEGGRVGVKILKGS